ncbi:hypothetical protein ACFE04_022603 [Oxalis oulophora]
MPHTLPPLSSSLLADDDTNKHWSGGVGAGGGGKRRLLGKMMKLLLDLVHRFNKSPKMASPKPVDATKNNSVGINSSFSNNYMRTDGKKTGNFIMVSGEFQT